MKVRAKEPGYYGHRRRKVGEEFTLEPIKRMRKDAKTGNMREVTIMPEQQFSTRWMEKVDVPVEKPKKEKTPAPEPVVTDGV